MGVLLGHQNSQSIDVCLGGHNSFRDAPLYTTIFAKEPCVVICLAYSKNRTPSYSRHGVGLVEHFGDLMVHTITPNGIFGLNSESLQFWSDGKNGVKVATLVDEKFPDFFEVKGMSVTEHVDYYGR
jgi:hypothetical protein